MKTTLEIDDALLLAAKRAALDRRTTLRALVEAGLKKELTTKPGRRRPLKLITHPGGLPPELNLSNRRAMREWFDAVDETRSVRGRASLKLGWRVVPVIVSPEGGG